MEVQNQVAFHRLFCIQGMTGWIIFVILEEPGEKGYSSALGRVGVCGHTHTTESHFYRTFYSYYWGRSGKSKSQEGQKIHW